VSGVSRPSSLRTSQAPQWYGKIIPAALNPKPSGRATSVPDVDADAHSADPRRAESDSRRRGARFARRAGRGDGGGEGEGRAETDASMSAARARRCAARGTWPSREDVFVDDSTRIVSLSSTFVVETSVPGLERFSGSRTDGSALDDNAKLRSPRPPEEKRFSSARDAQHLAHSPASCLTG
jgi:hypothetical protein